MERGQVQSWPWRVIVCRLGDSLRLGAAQRRGNPRAGGPQRLLRLGAGALCAQTEGLGHGSPGYSLAPALQVIQNVWGDRQLTPGRAPAGPDSEGPSRAEEGTDRGVLIGEGRIRCGI